MSHFDFVRPSGQWPAELVPGASDFQRMDSRAFRSLNGDLGGIYSSAKPLVIGGAGLQLGAASYFRGGVRTRSGGRIVSNGVPVFSGPQPQTLTVPALALGTRIVNGGSSQRFDKFVARTASSSRWGLSFASPPNELGLDVPRRYLHQGAMLLSIVVEFYLSQRPAALPTTSMQLFPQGHDTTGNVVDFTPGPENIVGWATATPYGLGAYINPASQGTNRGYYYKLTTAGTGTSGAAEPAWTTVVGSPTPADSNGQIWTCTGRNGWLSTHGQNVDTYFANGAGQTLGFDTDPASTAGLNTMDNVSHGLTLFLTNLDALVAITGIQMVYTAASFAFE